MRSAAGVVTSLGLVMLLIALIVVPATPVFAATPTLDVTNACDGDDNLVVFWTTTSTNQTPDGGTADGAVTVTESLDYNGSITDTVVVGEYNDGNGYEMSGSFIALDGTFVPGVSGGFVKVTVEVDGFNDGTGQSSVVMSSWIRVNRCKNGTTTTASPTTTTAPVTLSASVTAACVLDNGIATYPITVTVSGDEGATGVVTINGVATAYAIGASGEAVVLANGVEGNNTVEVVDDVFGSILSDVIALQDCGETTTTTEATTTTTEAPTTTTDPAESTTTSEASSTDGTPPVSVLPTEIDQTELPQTGIDNGPLAAMGVTMLLGGAGLLIAARRQEALGS